MKRIPDGKIIKYRLYDVEDGEVRRAGKVITYNEEHGKYHVADRMGKGWASYGMYWIDPDDIREVTDDDSSN